MKNREWVRFVSEPWTTDAWAKSQETLPDDGLPINIILYADKALASSWGTKKVYPIMARLANLPRAVRNGQGIGGGRIVGLLPVVDKAPPGLSSTYAANFKCNVWHRGMEKLLETIRMECQFGYAVELELHRALNLERKLWKLFPNIPILSADLEEQFVMGCVRGLGAPCPCPRCVEADDMLANLLHIAKPRLASKVRDMMERVKHLNIGQTEEVLREHSYRPVQSAFAILGDRMDVYHALSYDTLHNDDLGCWGAHLWPLLKSYLQEYCEPSVSTAFEERIDHVPPWPDTNHFPNVLSMEFSDRTKYEDLLRVVLHGAMALPIQASNLVELIRTQAELRILASFNVHTEETINRGRELVHKFHRLSEVCAKKYGKSFKFPKMHMLCHLFDDIWDKGASANFSTKPCEKMHGKLRHAYGTSSKKSSTVDSEVLHTIHTDAAYKLIEAEIEEFMATQRQDAEEEEDKPEDQAFHINLGSKDRQLSTDLLEQKHIDNPACRNLGARISDLVNQLDPAFIQPGDTIKVVECHYLRVQYESVVDWCLYRDKLRCSPMVYGRPRFDCVLVDREDGVHFARLHLLLECQNSADSSKTMNLALVSYFQPVLNSIGVME
ncbi:hypothetical protein FS749_006981 [Ceratobasidium sp. UAMH 11750]|nr:hypothetical protein FS749_006981 [Ceratobasidium sp. UAMH 11750]